MAVDYFVLSNFGVRYFIGSYTDSDTIPNSVGPDVEGIQEITDVISCDGGKFSKENTKYRTLNSNGWESIATLGNSADDITFECIRTGKGNPYDGTEGSQTYNRVKHWFMEATQNAGAESPKVLIELLPRGPGVYEGTCFYIVPNNWGPGTRDTETGQEYSFVVSPFGPQQPLVVNYVPASGETKESWTLSKPPEQQAVRLNVAPLSNILHNEDT